MSDDFDKEAEREKLREQFAEERERREATQQMSELLLKGATMTNKHCDTCGDPIFRHEGQEFCANCQTAAAASGAEAPAERGQQGRQGRGDRQPRTGDAERTDAARQRAQSPPEPQPSDDADATRADADDDGASEVPVEAEPRHRNEVDRTPATNRRQQAPERTPTRATGSDESPGVDAGDGLEAPAALRRALEKFSREAAAADDPREAQGHLAAAREAAEALSALRR